MVPSISLLIHEGYRRLLIKVLLRCKLLSGFHMAMKQVNRSLLPSQEYSLSVRGSEIPTAVTTAEKKLLMDINTRIHRLQEEVFPHSSTFQTWIVNVWKVSRNACD